MLFKVDADQYQLAMIISIATSLAVKPRPSKSFLAEA